MQTNREDSTGAGSDRLAPVQSLNIGGKNWTFESVAQQVAVLVDMIKWQDEKYNDLLKSTTVGGDVEFFKRAWAHAEERESHLVRLGAHLKQ
jgi:hypothetical protein